MNWWVLPFLSPCTYRHKCVYQHNQLFLQTWLTKNMHKVFSFIGAHLSYKHLIIHFCTERQLHMPLHRYQHFLGINSMNVTARLNTTHIFWLLETLPSDPRPPVRRSAAEREATHLYRPDFLLWAPSALWWWGRHLLLVGEPPSAQHLLKPRIRSPVLFSFLMVSHCFCSFRNLVVPTDFQGRVCAPLWHLCQWCASWGGRPGQCSWRGGAGVNVYCWITTRVTCELTQ